MQTFVVVLVACCVLVAGTYAYTAANVRSAEQAYDALRSAVRGHDDLKSSPFYPALQESLRTSFAVALSDDAVQPTVDPALVEKQLQEVEIHLFAGKYNRQSNGYENTPMYHALWEERWDVVGKAMQVENALAAYLHHVGRDDRREAAAPLATSDARRKAEWAGTYEAEQRASEHGALVREREALKAIERKIELG